MEQDTTFRLVHIELERIVESLSILADDIQYIAEGNADASYDHEAWAVRCRAGTQVARLRAMLNGGDLDLADCPYKAVEWLRSVWTTLGYLHYGEHSQNPSAYRGPLHLPHEFDKDGRLRYADEEFDKYEQFQILPKVDREKLEAALNKARRKVAKEAGQEHLYKPTKIEWTTTKREEWSWLPGELRMFARFISRYIPAATEAFGRTTSQRAAPNGDDKSSDQHAPDSPHGPSYLPSQLAGLLDMSCATLNKYAKDAGVTTAKKGQRNFRYSYDAAVRILNHISVAGSSKEMIVLAQQLLDEIKKKPKGRNQIEG